MYVNVGYALDSLLVCQNITTTLGDSEMHATKLNIHVGSAVGEAAPRSSRNTNNGVAPACADEADFTEIFCF
jgi:hypothetical protein